MGSFTVLNSGCCLGGPTAGRSSTPHYGSPDGRPRPAIGASLEVNPDRSAHRPKKAGRKTLIRRSAASDPAHRLHLVNRVARPRARHVRRILSRQAGVSSFGRSRKSARHLEIRGGAVARWRWRFVGAVGERRVVKPPARSGHRPRSGAPADPRREGATRVPLGATWVPHGATSVAPIMRKVVAPWRSLRRLDLEKLVVVKCHFRCHLVPLLSDHSPPAWHLGASPPASEPLPRNCAIRVGTAGAELGAQVEHGP